MTISLPIKKVYLKQKVQEQQETGVFHERRALTKYWRKRIGSPTAWERGGKAVFLCGRDTFRATVRRVTIEPTPSGIGGAVPSALCYNIECQFEAFGFVKVCVEGW